MVNCFPALLIIGIEDRIEEKRMSLVRAAANALARGISGPLPKYFNAEEVHRILEAMSNDKESHLIVHFLWKTGVRASEAIQVRLGDIDPYNKTLRVVTLKKSRRKKRGPRAVREHERIIPIQDDLLAEILTWSREKDLEYHGLLFPFTRSTLFRRVRKACHKAGFKDERAHPHTFRHSYAVHLLKNGVPVTVVQALLGHSSIENTAIYLAIVQSEATEMVRRVEW